jgi:16S rRNA (adenine1518-N6/adenine1519-N6)-dimethyltransferase
LIDDTVVDRIASLCELKRDDTVVEVGPGHGQLTVRLAASKAAVVAVEFDRDLIDSLKASVADRSNVTIVNEDFLRFVPQAERFVLAGNIPYNLTSPIIDWCLKYRDRIERAVLMVQKELAERICGSPGSKAWSPLSIMTQLSFDASEGFDVPPESFSPPPRVISTVIRLTPHAAPEIEDLGPLRKVLRAAFAHRRKILTNNLTSGLHLSAASARVLLETMHLPSDIRAEQLSIDQFLSLTEHLKRDSIV